MFSFRPRRSLALLATLAMTAAGALTAGSGTALADDYGFRKCSEMPGPIIPDPNNPPYGQGQQNWYYYEFALVGSQPVFNVSDTRIATNNTDSPIQVTFSSQKSETFTLTASATMGASLLKFLNASVSGSISKSRTTSIGVSTTATVPAHQTVRGEYGVAAYNVTYNVTTWVRNSFIGAGGITYTSCYRYEPKQQFTNAPTVDEGWRVGLA